MLLQEYTKNIFLLTPICLVIISFLTIFEKKYFATTKYYIWNILCLAFLIPSKLYSYLIPKKTYDFFGKNEVNFIPKIFSETEQILTSTKIEVDISNLNDFIFSFEKTIFIIWIIGCLVYFFYNILKHLFFTYKVFRWSAKIDDENILSLLEKTKKEQNIKSKIQVKYCYMINSPLLIMDLQMISWSKIFQEINSDVNIFEKLERLFVSKSFSFFKPTILIPHNININYLDYVFKHELSHYKYFDLNFQFFRLIVQSLYWFNPVVWIICRLADKDMEKACDFRVLRLSSPEKRKEYADAILHVISLGNQKTQILTTNFSKNKNEIYYRMEDIMNKNNRKKSGLILTFIVITIICLNVFSVDTFSNNPKSSAEQSNDFYYKDALIPLKETFEDLNCKVNYINENLISVIINDNKQFNFINEINYNLKKNKSTYFMTDINKIPAIKIAVLEDLGYKIEESEKGFSVLNNKKYIPLKIDYFSKILDQTNEKISEKDLVNNNTLSNPKIIKTNVDIKNIKDYKFENVNKMSYNLKQLEEYIEANYNQTLAEYKKSLILLEDKYPSTSISHYDLLENGQVYAFINTENDSFCIELGIEVRNNKIFVEK